MKPIDTTKSKGANDLEYWRNELEKCTNDSYYFFHNYFLINGKKTTLTREEYYARLGFIICKLKGKR